MSDCNPSPFPVPLPLPLPLPLPFTLPLSPQVTPSSKVVGDLAQFMVSQRLEPEDVLEQVRPLIAFDCL
jgi:hypothetical protein